MPASLESHFLLDLEALSNLWQVEVGFLNVHLKRCGGFDGFLQMWKKSFLRERKDSPRWWQHPYFVLSPRKLGKMNWSYLSNWLVNHQLVAKYGVFPILWHFFKVILEPLSGLSWYCYRPEVLLFRCFLRSFHFQYTIRDAILVANLLRFVGWSKLQMMAWRENNKPIQKKRCQDWYRNPFLFS